MKPEYKQYEQLMLAVAPLWEKLDFDEIAIKSNLLNEYAGSYEAAKETLRVIKNLCDKDDYLGLADNWANVFVDVASTMHRLNSESPSDGDLSPEDIDVDDKPKKPVKQKASDKPEDIHFDGTAGALLSTLQEFIKEAGVSKQTLDTMAKGYMRKLEEFKADILEQVAKRVSDIEPRRIVIEKPDGTVVSDIEERVHDKFGMVLALVNAGINVQLVGPAGSGKTHLTRQIAQALNVVWYPQSVSLDTRKSDLFGYTTPDGNYVGAPFSEAFMNGGLWTIDEFDLLNPSIAPIVNAAIANGICSLPCGTVEAHPDFRCVACSNTYGTGASYEYVGRIQQDAATLNRFATVFIDYDQKLETALFGEHEFKKRVWQLRTAIASAGARLIASTRSIKMGITMIDMGMDMDEVVDSLIFKGAGDDVKRRVMGYV